MSVTAVSLDVLGDFNGDGTLGIDDLDTLTTAIQLNSVDNGNSILMVQAKSTWPTVSTGSPTSSRRGSATRTSMDCSTAGT